MTHVLDNQRVWNHALQSAFMLKISFQVFLLVDEGTVEKYKADLSDEVEPQITELLTRAEKGMKALQRTQLGLQTKVPPVLFVSVVYANRVRSRLNQLVRGLNRARPLVGRIVACKCS
jgi:hypothetical protein